MDKKIITLDGLQHYDENIKEYINNELEPLEPLQRSQTLCELLFNPVDLKQYAVPNEQVNKRIPDKYLTILTQRKPMGLFYYDGNPILSAERTSEDNREIEIGIWYTSNNIIDYLYIYNKRLMEPNMPFIISFDVLNIPHQSSTVKYCTPASVSESELFDNVYFSYETVIEGNYCDLMRYPIGNCCVYIESNYNTNIKYITQQCFSQTFFIEKQYIAYYKSINAFDMYYTNTVPVDILCDAYVVSDFSIDNTFSDNYMLLDKITTGDAFYLYSHSYIILVYDDFNSGIDKESVWVSMRSDTAMYDALLEDTYIDTYSLEFNTYIINRLGLPDNYKVAIIPIKGENMSGYIDIELYEK